MANFYPGLNRLLVKQSDLPSNSSIITITADQKYAYGEIIAVGTIKDKKEFDEGHFEKGDNIYYLAQAGIDIDLPDGTFRLLQVQDVLVGVKGE